MISLRQRELAEWAGYNFKDKKADSFGCALGMTEELGELCHWLLKRNQGIRNATPEKAKEEIADAFADVVIFGIQLMSCEGINAEEVLSRTIQTVLQRDWTKDPTGSNFSQHKE